MESKKEERLKWEKIRESMIDILYLRNLRSRIDLRASSKPTYNKPLQPTIFKDILQRIYIYNIFRY